MGWFIFRATKFVVSLVCFAIACTLVWDGFINGKLYDCTDGGSLDFWFVGDWVHHPVPVEHVVTRRSMSEPDTIKLGWTVAGLWRLWACFVVLSVLGSFIFACVPWTSRIEAAVERLYERTHPA